MIPEGARTTPIVPHIPPCLSDLRSRLDSSLYNYVLRGTVPFKT